MQSKTTLLYFSRPIRMEKVPKHYGNMMVRVGSGRNFYILLLEMQNDMVTWKTGQQFLIKLNTLLPYNCVTLFHSIYPKELKLSHVQRCV